MKKRNTFNRRGKRDNMRRQECNLLHVFSQQFSYNFTLKSQDMESLLILQITTNEQHTYHTLAHMQTLISRLTEVKIIPSASPQYYC